MLNQLRRRDITWNNARMLSTHTTGGTHCDGCIDCVDMRPACAYWHPASTWYAVCENRYDAATMMHGYTLDQVRVMLAEQIAT